MRLLFFLLKSCHTEEERASMLLGTAAHTQQEPASYTPEREELTAPHTGSAALLLAGLTCVQHMATFSLFSTRIHR